MQTAGKKRKRGKRSARRTRSRSVEPFLDLPGTFPGRSFWIKFLKRFLKTGTYWYIPKARTLDDENLKIVRGILLVILEEFLDTDWTQKTQLKLHKRLVEEKLIEPRADAAKAKSSDITALERIGKVFLEYLGVAWITEQGGWGITDVGLEFLTQEDYRGVIERQVAKLQLPRFEGDEHAGVRGIIPHLFLLEVLQAVGSRLSREEFTLFVNLADSREDLEQVVKYIKGWRELKEKDRELVKSRCAEMPVFVGDDGILLEEVSYDWRYCHLKRIELNYSYQRAYYGYPSYIAIREGAEYEWTCDESIVGGVVRESRKDLHITGFANREDWFDYFGDPARQPSWFNNLQYKIQVSETHESAIEVLREKELDVTLSEEEEKTLAEQLAEKEIEEFYRDRLGLLETGLKLYKAGKRNGQQFPTIVGRVDLLCVGADGDFVVVEIKRDDASDAAIGQTLRYVGWVYQHLCKENSVRSIVLAGGFPDKVRYARIGLLKKDADQFMQFKKHMLKPEDV